MGFTLYYFSTRPLDVRRRAAICASASALNEGRTWLSCEPISFFPANDRQPLAGGSKPNFQSHPDDVAAAEEEGLPDGTIHDLIDLLAQLSREHGVDWQFSHDHDPGPIGLIRGGQPDRRLLAQIEAFAELAEIMAGAAGNPHQPHKPPAIRQRQSRPAGDEDDNPPILRLFPDRD